MPARSSLPLEKSAVEYRQAASRRVSEPGDGLRWKAALIGVISAFALEALSKRTRDLDLLLEATTAFSSARRFDELLALFCQKTIELVESTFSRVYLLEPDGAHLALSAFYARRDVGMPADRGRLFPLGSLPWHQLALVANQPIVLRRDDPRLEISALESALLFGPGGRSALLMPFAAGDTCLGVETLCEMRSWKRTSFDDEKIRLCHAVARQAALAAVNLRAYESAASQNERGRLLIENLADGVFTTDRECRIESLNPAATSLLGYSIEQVRGKRCADFLHGMSEEGRPLCEDSCPIRQLAASESAAQPIRIKAWITCQDGRSILISHHAAPLKDARGRVMGAISLIRDISREEELARMKSDLISLVSHELRGPLTDIRAATELLEESDLERSRQKDVLQVLSQESARLVRLVDEMLAACRLEQGHFELALEPLSLPPILERMARTYETQHRDHHFCVTLARAPLFVLGDVVCLEVTLKNLLQNAVLYSPAGSTVTLSARERLDDILVSVADQGSGIAPDQLERVFEPFYRLHAPEDRAASGYGLGLYIARMMVKAQGGMIWAESQPGRGSCFSFVLSKPENRDEKKDSDCG